MAIDDVPCCEAYEVHEDKIRAANEQMPDEDELYVSVGDVCMRSGTVTEYEPVGDFTSA